MKRNFPITEREVTYPADRQLISATDLNGVITYCNDTFAEVAGFAPDELVGSSHNIVRHPHMPQAAFADLWATLKAGRPWMGIVKNRSRSGDYYWVDAFVTPVYDRGKVVGYESVRTKPQPETRARAERLYRLLGPAATADGKGMNGEASARAAARLTRRRLTQTAEFRMMAANTVLFGAVVGCALAGLGGAWMAAVAATLGLASVAAVNLFMSPIRSVTRRIGRMADNPIMQFVYSGRGGEAGQMELALNLLQGAQRTVLRRVGEHAGKLRRAAAESNAMLSGAVKGLESQRTQTDMIATAIHEMTATVAEVARNTAAAADAARHAAHETAQGKSVVGTTAATIERLAAEIGSASQVMGQLLEGSERISKFADLIREVADQTNLLALNASIEAARAGEHGRGFAVVATEVRSLATRSHQTTEEIRHVVERLQAIVNQTVEGMQATQALSEEGVQSTRLVVQALDTIAGTVASISDMNTEIATAAEEQTAVAEEINRSVVSIRDAAEQTDTAARRTQQTTTGLSTLAHELDALVVRFGAER